MLEIVFFAFLALLCFFGILNFLPFLFDIKTHLLKLATQPFFLLGSFGFNFSLLSLAFLLILDSHLLLLLLIPTHFLQLLLFILQYTLLLFSGFVFFNGVLFLHFFLLVVIHLFLSELPIDLSGYLGAYASLFTRKQN